LSRKRNSLTPCNSSFFPLRFVPNPSDKLNQLHTLYTARTMPNCVSSIVVGFLLPMCMCIGTSP
jgi:hypothetical protein